MSRISPSSSSSSSSVSELTLQGFCIPVFFLWHSDTPEKVLKHQIVNQKVHALQLLNVWFLTSWICNQNDHTKDPSAVWGVHCQFINTKIQNSFIGWECNWFIQLSVNYPSIYIFLSELPAAEVGSVLYAPRCLTSLPVSQSSCCLAKRMMLT